MLDTSCIYTHTNEKLISLCGIRISPKMFRHSTKQYTKEMWLVMGTAPLLKYCKCTKRLASLFNNM